MHREKKQIQFSEFSVLSVAEIQIPIRSSYPFYELQNVNILRQIRVSKMSPQMLILLRFTKIEHCFFAEKRIFIENSQQISDSMKI